MRWRWPPWRPVKDRTGEALEHLRQLEENDQEIARLSAELRETQRRNNFSELIDVAISRRRAREEGGP